MNSAKKYRLLDLIEQIERLGEMLRIHESNPVSVMREQYLAMQSEFVHQFIVEVLKSDWTERDKKLILIQGIMGKANIGHSIQSAGAAAMGNNKADAWREIEAALTC